MCRGRAMWRGCKKTALYKPRREASGESKSSGILILDFLPSEVRWSEFLQATVSVIFCYSTPKQINIVLKRPCFLLPLCQLCFTCGKSCSSVYKWLKGGIPWVYLFLSPEDTVQCQAQSVRSLISCLTLHFPLADKGGGGIQLPSVKSASQTSSHGVNLVNHMSTFQKRPTRNSKRIRKCQTVSQAIGRSIILWNLHLFLHICK